MFFGCVFVWLFACYQGISAVISFLSIKIPVVDRQCLVLDRQCRKKKSKKPLLRTYSWADSLFIWFPAAWMLLVVDTLSKKRHMHSESTGQLRAVAFPDQYSLCCLKLRSLVSRSRDGRSSKVGVVPSSNTFVCIEGIGGMGQCP